MTGSRTQRIRRHYEARIDPARDTYDILDWSSRASQELRFAVLLRVLRGSFPEPVALRLLDVGCGLTDLASFLERHRLPVRYVGADLTLGILREARRRCPQRCVVAADVFTAPPFPARSFDVVYCSGVFNLSLGNNDAFVQAGLPRLVDLCSGLAVANFLHCRTARKYEHCHYFDPRQLVAAMQQHGLQVALLEDYLENDFTLVLQRAGEPRPPKVGLKGA